jgi:flagellar hook-associated protein 2
MAISATGLGSGLDLKALVEQLVSAERQPVANRLALQEAKATAQLTALGRLKSALATFQDAVEELADIDALRQRTVSVSDAERIAATASAAAQPASYQIEVLALASAHRLFSGPYASSGSVVGEGQLVVQSGADSMQIEITAANNTLAGIRDAINESAANPGVRATIVTGSDGAHLVLVATRTGAAHAITVDALTPGSPLEALEFGAGTVNAMTQASAAADASARIEGFAVTSATNTIEDAIEGVTIDLLQAEEGTIIDLDITHDVEAARRAATKFVDAYNALTDTIAQLTKYDAESGTGAVLLGDAATRSIKSTLRQVLGSTVGTASAPFRTLAEIGITTGNDARLTLDKTKFDAALEADFDGMGRLFADESHGVAVRLQSLLETMLSDDGRLRVRETTLKARIGRISDSREDLDLRMEQVRKRYERQFNALDRLVSQLNQTSSFLSRQLAGL